MSRCGHLRDFKDQDLTYSPSSPRLRIALSKRYSRPRVGSSYNPHLTIRIRSAGGEYISFCLYSFSLPNLLKRSGTPLVYRAVPGWFIRVSNIKEELVGNNKDTRWYVYIYYIFPVLKGRFYQGTAICGRQQVWQLARKCPGLERLS
jgi:hypothetical protein